MSNHPKWISRHLNVDLVGVVDIDVENCAFTRIHAECRLQAADRRLQTQAGGQAAC